ncbi:hypothetical protein [Vibrio spartinae]|uniref:hypothetical protein n=1 Tax=Vibrio spartinae TaxID=1918945 RepID=UPI001E46A2BC|nr:hypothetical protein [Vibrio spartinae]
MELTYSHTGFKITHKGRVILEHTPTSPAFYLGVGQSTFDMYRGNFDIKDYLTERLPLTQFTVTENSDDSVITFSLNGQYALTARVFETAEKRLKIEFTALDKTYNRFWIRIAAAEDEAVYGCGEQLSYFNLRGKNFPLWSSEPGVGRNKNTYTTWQADVKDKAGGNYYNTNYPHRLLCQIKNTSAI